MCHQHHSLKSFGNHDTPGYPTCVPVALDTWPRMVDLTLGNNPNTSDAMIEQILHVPVASGNWRRLVDPPFGYYLDWSILTLMLLLANFAITK